MCQPHPWTTGQGEQRRIMRTWTVRSLSLCPKIRKSHLLARTEDLRRKNGCRWTRMRRILLRGFREMLTLHGTLSISSPCPSTIPASSTGCAADATVKSAMETIWDTWVLLSSRMLLLSSLRSSIAEYEFSFLPPIHPDKWSWSDRVQMPSLLVSEVLPIRTSMTTPARCCSCERLESRNITYISLEMAGVYV
ncbi:hypothetical protein MLD38_008721 [Melastoma candidum]|uniref:Uncharacterized protein n=1 Tax=Melastoma candidum TaxID=119954 RepID=A0ACB9RWM6_9MYRT|nr:hypothetical protein MLD38_008721 [Melastoma candidum]